MTCYELAKLLLAMYGDREVVVEYAVCGPDGITDLNIEEISGIYVDDELNRLVLTLD